MTVGLALGVLLAVQFRVTREIQSTEPVQRTKELAAQVNQAKDERDALQGQVDNLRAELDKAMSLPQTAEIMEELDRARIEAGVTELTGPGVEVTLNDSIVSLKPGQDPNLYVLHDEDVLRVLNELRAAGAEAISMNGQRLLATTEVRCTGPTVLLNKNKRLAPPYVITAIGNPDTLESSLKMKGGVAETLQFWGIQATVKKLPQVVVPPYSGGIKFEYAKAAV
ncbi:hypothetical protein Psfp_00114 [Pelotomaculum sp. FP]|uniref:DUF881 domain-containing protein n=1 Tax=Pelotomaculum sp. FP TaxID=261474 RepID=UPI00106643E7|nr:DUF881 domain-containing protein [Pelotomaculum sp. FP]TEB17991.1 hypothetical protein Psfp_00114 [Pelotomaculum sp. FP]